MIPFPGISMGCDYNPEQWPRSVWRDDVALMREAGVGFVTLGVFSWALLQPAPDRWDFAWFDEILGLLHEGGIAIDMATATASPPPWLTAAHPEMLPVDDSMQVVWPGSRQSWCPSSPVFRTYALALVEEMARRYGDHPAVRLWHVSNELGCHNGRCWCDVSAAAFRVWLADRYGSPQKLNDAWGTAFWSQHYGSFDEVLPPRRTGAAPNPTHALDFARFSSDELISHYRAERDVIRRHSAVPVTTNLMVTAHQDQQDNHAFARELDVVSNDHYLDARLPDRHAELAFAADLTRGVARGEPWLLMETATSAVNWQPVNTAKRPGELLLDALTHVARGADGIAFFQWRASRAGAEKFHSALLPHAGADSARFREVVALGDALARLAPVAGSRVAADVALLFDWEAWWACDQPSHPSGELRYLDAAHRWHAAFTGLGATVDVVHPSADLSSYAVVVVPTLYLCSDAAAAAVADAAAGGAQVLVTYFSGIVDGDDHIRLGGYPGAFRELLGVRGEEFAPLRPGESVTLDDGRPDSRWTADLWTEVLAAPDAEVLARYVDGPVAGAPAITRRVIGTKGASPSAAPHPDPARADHEGRGSPGSGAGEQPLADGAAWYVATRLDPAATAGLAGRIATAAGIVVDGSGIALTRRGRFVFALNRGEMAAAVDVRGTDLLTGAPFPGTLAAGSAAVVDTARAEVG